MQPVSRDQFNTYIIMELALYLLAKISIIVFYLE